ncbi:MAG: ribosome-associated translation inhibitor RaiA [Lentisphaeria bacterium]|nr:ribosome-associated translation inhibitor RaiA [Lentisphaeria bacterium]
MEVIVSARHFDVDESIKEYVTEKMSKLSEEYAKLTTARVVLSLERNWQVAEGHVTGKQLDMEARASTTDMYSSIDEISDKLERQLRRHLGKMREHRHQVSLSEALVEETAGDVGDAEEFEEVAAV